MPDAVEIEDVATTKTAAQIDPDGDYAVLQSAAGDTFKALVEQVVRGVLAQIVSELEINDDVSIGGDLVVDGVVGVKATAPKNHFQLGDAFGFFAPVTTGTSAYGVMARNAYNDGAWKRLVADNQVGMLQIDAGGNLQYFAQSDANATADSAITFAERIRITNAGNTRPGSDNALDLGEATHRWDDVYATNGTIQTSDRRMKSDIADSDLGLDFVRSLRPVSFQREGGKRRHYGLIAQEVEAALNGRDFAGLIYDAESDRYGMRYDELIAPLIKAVQEQQSQIVALIDRVAELEDTHERH